jgi:small-conductance mechanosensitive channel
MTSGVADAGAGAWFPRTLGVAAILLALAALADLILTPAARAEQVLFGYMFKGTAAQVVTVLHVLVFSFGAWGCLTRKPFMVWVVMGYFVYLIFALWIWTALYGARAGAHPTPTILMNGLASVMLLALCRVTYGRRRAFCG